MPSNFQKVFKKLSMVILIIIGFWVRWCPTEMWGVFWKKTFCKAEGNFDKGEELNLKAAGLHTSIVRFPFYIVTISPCAATPVFTHRLSKLSIFLSIVFLIILNKLLIKLKVLKYPNTTLKKVKLSPKK